MRPTNDLHVIDTQPLRTPGRAEGRPAHLRPARRSSCTARAKRSEALLRGRDSRLLVVVGPCSVHDPAAAIEYAERLARPPAPARGGAPPRDARLLREAAHDASAGRGSSTIRTSTEATTSPPVCGSARELLLRLADDGHARRPPRCSTRSSRSTSPISCRGRPSARARPRARRTARWRAASRCPSATRTGRTEASTAAIHALAAASRPHSFLGIDGAGRVAIVRTAGNPDGHVVLRGGNAGPNYAAEHVATAAAALAKAGRSSRACSIDCSHDNSGKSHLKQPHVVEEVGRAGGRRIAAPARRHDREQHRRRPAEVRTRGCRRPT